MQQAPCSRLREIHRSTFSCVDGRCRVLTSVYTLQCLQSFPTSNQRAITLAAIRATILTGTGDGQKRGDAFLLVHGEILKASQNVKMRANIGNRGHGNGIVFGCNTGFLNMCRLSGLIAPTCQLFNVPSGDILPDLIISCGIATGWMNGFSSQMGRNGN